MDIFWNEVELARRWGISHRTLQRWRSQQKGPPYLKLCGKIVYSGNDVIRWENDSRRLDRAR